MANKFYEEWMDYKDRERRASSTTTETISSVKNKDSGKYRLYDEYMTRLSQSETATSTPLLPPQPIEATSVNNFKKQARPISKVSKEISNSVIDWDNLDDDLKEQIRKELAPFYKWVTNGKMHDLRREIIEKLLFRKK